MPQFNEQEVKDWFGKFGYTDFTPAEITQFVGMDYIGGGSQIANYVQTKTEQKKAEANNPLKLFVEEEKVRRKDFELKAENLYTQLQETLSAAPKLFGNLSPEQIGQYIAPIAQATRENSALLEGDFARRGITGSNIEANAMADAARKYQQAVLKTGLELGLNTQGAQASAIQSRLAQMFGSAGQASSLLGAGSGGLTDMQMKNMEYITQLPHFLRALNQQGVLFDKAMQKPNWLQNLGGNINDFRTVTSGVSDIMGDVRSIMGGSPAPAMPGGSGAPPVDPAALALL